MSPFWKKEKKSEADKKSEVEKTNPPAAEEKIEAAQPEITAKPAEAEVKEMAAAKPKVLTAVMSGCTGCLISLCDNYDILLDLLNAIDYRYEKRLRTHDRSPMTKWILPLFTVLYVCKTRDRLTTYERFDRIRHFWSLWVVAQAQACLLYTSDAADDLLCVDLGGRRI